jgi:CRISPR-associated endonuclease/helicase Cas3
MIKMKKFEEFEVSIPGWINEKHLAHNYLGQSETLLEHIERTRESFLKLIREGEFENLIDQQISKIFSNQHNEIKELILNIISLHDLGKINPGFQKEKMSNSKYQNHRYRNTEHSELGWILFNLHFFDFLDQIKEDQDWKHVMILTSVIAGHHTCAWGINRNKDKELTDQKN